MALISVLGLWCIQLVLRRKLVPHRRLEHAFRVEWAPIPIRLCARSAVHLHDYAVDFAIITPALIPGGNRRRMKFSGTILFLTLWFLVGLRAPPT